LSNQDEVKKLSDQVVAEVIGIEKSKPTTKKLLTTNLLLSYGE
jgi:hypothetical protein